MEEEKKSNTKNKTKIRFNVMAIILIIIFCCAIAPVTLQNDTFYTIKIGEHIINNGIDMHDPFSYHDIEYTYPHWLYDVGIYLIYNNWGQTGIYVSTIVLASILGITIYLTNSKLNKNSIISFVITIGTLYVLRSFIAARAQLVTFILFVLTVYFIEQFLETKKKRYAFGLIIIPILIANLHTAVFPFYFILYMPYIGEYIINALSSSRMIVNKGKLKDLEKKLKNAKDQDEIDAINESINALKEQNKKLLERQQKIDQKAYKIKIARESNVKYLIIIMIICLFTGFLTPIGTTPYTYLVKTMMGNTTHNIAEHLPLVLVNNTNYIVVLILFLGILMFTDTKIRLCDLFMLGGLTFLTFYTRRQESMFVIICGFILNRLIMSMFNKYAPEAPEKIEDRMTKIIGIITTTALILTLSITNYKPKINDKYIDESSYPVMASDYILSHLDIKNIKLYNDYNYGSYLLFRGIPVFIDSRADLYSPEFNKGVDVFTDFLDISGVNKDNLEEMFDKYGFTHFITHNDSRLKTFLSRSPEEYEQIYEDDYFCIFERK